MIYPSVHSHMLSRSDNHVPARRHKHHCRLLRVRLWYPYLHREAICRASKVDRQCAGDCEQQSGCAMFVCIDLGAWAKRWIRRQRARSIRVCPLRVLVFLRSLHEPSAFSLLAGFLLHVARCRAMIAPSPAPAPYHRAMSTRMQSLPDHFLRLQCRLNPWPAASQ